MAVNYIFGDLLTGKVIEEIRLHGVSFKHTLDSGEFRASFYLDQTGKDNETLMTATTPGRTYVVVERDGVIIGDFIVWTRTYQSQAKVAQLYGIPFSEYPETRLITSDYSATDKEQRNIFLDLYRMMQADANSIRVDLPSEQPDAVLRTLDVAGDEYRTYRQLLDSIADNSDGFDWVIRTERVSGGRYQRRLEFGYPQLGALADDSMPVFEYTSTPDVQGGNITNYWCNDSMGSSGTHFYGIGSGEGAAMLVSQRTHTDLLTSGFPRYDTTYDRKDIDDQAFLDAQTRLRADLFKAPSSTITAEVLGDNEDLPFGSYGMGDACKLVIRDARFPNTLNKVTRILGWEYYPPSDDDKELVRFTFEGEEN